MTDYLDTLKAESASWLISNERLRADKFKRERIRHYKLIRDLKLDVLGVESMHVLEVGGGPQPVSDLLRCRSRVVVDPLTPHYQAVIPCPYHVTMQAEAMLFEEEFDLVLSTNALDHVENPTEALFKMRTALRPGGYMALSCAENNAFTHPHPAHVHNLTAAWVHDHVDHVFETVWELTYAEHGYRYGWRLWEGKRGQPAWALLLRDCRETK